MKMFINSNKFIKIHLYLDTLINDNNYKLYSINNIIELLKENYLSDKIKEIIINIILRIINYNIISNNYNSDNLIEQGLILLKYLKIINFLTVQWSLIHLDMLFIKII